MALIGIGMLVLFGCGNQKPTCPEMAYYQQATRISEEQEGSHTRIAVYQTIEEPNEILSFYKRELLAGGWQKVSETQDGVTFSYISHADNPPFTISIVMTEMRHGDTQYTVYLTIAGPFAGFDYWCTSTRP